MTEDIRVALVDDQELIRLGFRMILDAEPGIAVIGEAADGDAVMPLVRQQTPDVVLMDVRMPGTDGIAATRKIVADFPAVRVLVLTTFDLDEYAFGSLEAGASGFLLKDVQRSELVSAIRAVHRGDAVLAPRVTKRLIEVAAGSVQTADVPRPELESLTERERDVFLAMGRGASNHEIATALFLSESTVKTYVGRVLAKLGARDRVAAVVLAARWGLAG